jgi:hypothetical protein
MKSRALLIFAAGAFSWLSSMDATTLTVINTNDNLAGSLRQLVQDANPGDSIVFNIPTSDPNYNPTTHIFSINLSTVLVVNKDLTINGGPSKVTLRQVTFNTRVVNVNSGTVTLANLTLTGGTIVGNSVGGILNNGTLTLRNCTIQGNRGDLGGGGVGNNTTLTMINCTLQGNTSGSSGRAVSNFGTLTMNSCTLVGNTGGADAGTIFNAGTAHVRNCIIAGNGAYDVRGAFISDGYNFIGIQDANGSGFGISGSHDQVGTTASPANPQLGSLRDNGGPAQTMTPNSGSPVIDQGNSGLTSDERGLLRPVDQPGVANAGGGDASDIGAFELGLLQGGPTFTVTTTDEHSDGLCEADCTLWDAVNAADNNINNNSVIQFAPNLTGTITTLLQLGGMNVLRPMTIKGPSPRLLTISGSGQGRIFNVTSSGVTISGMKIANGHFSGNGGAIINSGDLTLQNCMLSTNQVVGGNGGGIYSTGAMTLNGCTVVGNNGASLGGGVHCESGSVNITNCSFVGNQATSGAGLTSRGTTTIRSSTFTGNMASNSGSQDGGGILLINAIGNIMNTIIANNTAAIWPDLAQSGGTLTADYDLIRDSTGWNPGAQGPHNIVGQDPQFAPAGLTNNGGSTDTVAILTGSPAANTGNSAIAPARDQRGYTRVGTVDIGAFELAGTLPPNLIPTVVSQKIHGGNAFDIPLPLTGPVGIECRSGGGGGNHKMIFTFPGFITVSNSFVTAGIGNVANFSVKGSQVTANLANVVDAQKITVGLYGISDGTDTNEITAPMGILLGDVTGNGVVNATDVSQAKIQSGQPLKGSNFRNDVNVSGSINASDVSSVKLRSGTALPP